LTLISAGNGTSLSLFNHIARIAQMRFIATRVARSLVSSSICVRHTGRGKGGGQFADYSAILNGLPAVIRSGSPVSLLYDRFEVRQRKLLFGNLFLGED